MKQNLNDGNLVPETWGSVVKEGVTLQELRVVPFELTLDYEYWSFGELQANTALTWYWKLTLDVLDDVMKSILPEELHEGLPSGWNTCGHIGKSQGFGFVVTLLTQ